MTALTRDLARRLAAKGIPPACIDDVMTKAAAMRTDTGTK